MKTILEAKDHLRKNYKSGASCPACGQLVKAYKRKLNSNMCKALAIIYNRTTDGSTIHVQNTFSDLGLRATTMDYTHLEKWGFIETGDVHGHWKITKKGKDFLANQSVASAYCLVYAGKVYEWSSEMITIEEALTKRFKLTDVMQL